MGVNLPGGGGRRKDKDDNNNDGDKRELTVVRSSLAEVQENGR